MAMSVAMKKSIKRLIDEFSPEALSSETGIGIRTLYRWRKNNKLPGGEGAQRWRMNLLTEAAGKLREKAAQQDAA